MKNTRSSRIDFGHKITIKVPNDNIEATILTVSDIREKNLINILPVSHKKIASNKTMNFSDIRRQEAYKKINEKLREG